MFQIQDAAGDPLTRFAALFSLIFSIMSLTYGCVYIVQFGTMRTMYKASRWQKYVPPLYQSVDAHGMLVFVGGAENQDHNMVEHLGSPSYARYLVSLGYDSVLRGSHVVRLADRLVV